MHGTNAIWFKHTPSVEGDAHTWQQMSSPRYSSAYTMHALAPHIHLLQNYIGVRLQHHAH